MQKTNLVPQPDWTVRVIPLPKEMAITGSVQVPAAELQLIVSGEDDPLVMSAQHILSPFALGSGGSNYPIRLLLASQCVGTNLEAWACKLNALPHASQAYAIVGHQVQEHAAEWLLIANTPCGLLAAARTFYQLVSPPQGTAAQRVLCLPLGEITDWPDIPERGLWTEGYLLDEFSPEELELFARHKLNLIEARVKA
jgi:hypothetical protein